MTPTAPLILRAPAKINLTLELVGRRPDGFHDICSVMQAVGLCDEITFAPAEALTLHSDMPGLEGPDNLVWRAAGLLRRACDVRAGAAITLRKRIPLAAGLGGGSSDAACALRGLSILWRLDVDERQLLDLAAQLGSDVPFFLVPGGCALAEGRGERLTPQPAMRTHWVVLVKPPIGIAARAAYAALRPDEWSNGRRTREWLAAVQQRQTVPPPFNNLEAAALRVAPEAARARDALLAAAAPHAVMSGSGSTYFAVLETQAAARAIHSTVSAAGQHTYLAPFEQTPSP